jgi:hypothetical protein
MQHHSAWNRAHGLTDGGDILDERPHHHVERDPTEPGYRAADEASGESPGIGSTDCQKGSLDMIMNRSWRGLGELGPQRKVART